MSHFTTVSSLVSIKLSPYGAADLLVADISQNTSIATGECCVECVWLHLSVCALTFKRLDLETSVLAHKYTFRKRESHCFWVAGNTVCVCDPIWHVIYRSGQVIS